MGTYWTFPTTRHQLQERGDAQTLAADSFADSVRSYRCL